MSNSSRRSKGRQKIEMKKMTNENSLQVTFTKRRNVLFNKASELCTLCDAEVGLIVFSPGGKLFSFAHPNLNVVIHSYLTGGPPRASDHSKAVGAHDNIANARAHLTELTDQVEVETKHAQELKRLGEATQGRWWWATPIDKMSIPQLNQFKVALQELKRNVEELLILSTTITVNPPTDTFFVGSSSSNPVPLPMLLNNHDFKMDQFGFN